MTVTPQDVDAAVEELRVRRPDVVVDDRARTRLAEVLADPEGQAWMESAGLLEGDSCGYPVEGGYYDVKADLAAAADLDEQQRAGVLARAVREWSDDYVLSGRSRLDRSWRSLVDPSSTD